MFTYNTNIYLSFSWYLNVSLMDLLTENSELHAKDQIASSPTMGVLGHGSPTNPFRGNLEYSSGCGRESKLLRATLSALQSDWKDGAEKGGWRWCLLSLPQICWPAELSWPDLGSIREEVSPTRNNGTGRGWVTTAFLELLSRNNAGMYHTKLKTQNEDST